MPSIRGISSIPIPKGGLLSPSLRKRPASIKALRGIKPLRVPRHRVV